MIQFIKLGGSFMPILYFFESIRTPVLDKLMLILTELGGETAFLAVALILYWCVDKRKAYYLMSVGFIGTITSQFMKIACQIPRPWVRDPSFTIVEAAREGAGGYSFPSGHSQSSVGTFGSIAMTAKQKWLRIVSICICIIVPVTRMYLGVHTPQDVLVGSAISLVLLFALKPVVFGQDGKHIPKLFAGLVALAMIYIAYIELFPFPADIDPHNMASAEKNAYTLLGTMLGMAIVYRVDMKWLHFSTEGTLKTQILKVLGGIVVVLLIKEGLRAPLDAIFSGHLIARSIRYGLIVLFAGIIWPMSFPAISRLDRKD